ncbi:MAG: YggS family pyridoxal phosphate-dependent enzyme [Candidatus Omnitrophica bacterium]|nr:YggS family pyridoxal phosphate-dependent enzyme [Candidatus Omnitrophota bacterium]
MISDNIKEINNRIKLACKKSGRDPSEITLVCVTKGIDPYRISEVFVHGIKDIGENRVKEALKKKPAVLPGAKWHLIGHLQTNKVKDAIEIFGLMHSVDSLELARKIDKEAKKKEKRVDMLIQVNTSGEESKYGIRPEEVSPFLKEASQLTNVKILGLMTITPLTEDPEKVRPYLRLLKEVFESVGNEAIPNVEMKYLSMGMSQDYGVAVEEGANMIRIGSAIFRE